MRQETGKGDCENLVEFLGKPRFKDDHAEEKAQVGTVTGLAWTSVGGDTLTIEVVTMPGKGEMILTGNLGDVMKESARIALSYVRSVASQYGVKEDFFGKMIYIYTSLRERCQGWTISRYNNVCCNSIGSQQHSGQSQTGNDRRSNASRKSAAYRRAQGEAACCKTIWYQKVLIPEQNQPDVEELDAEITEGMELVYVSDMSQVERESLVKD